MSARGRISAGVTLIELLVVMGIVSVLLAVSYPTALEALEGVRLRTAADRAGSFWVTARQYADRYQTVVQVTVDPEKNELRAIAEDASWRREASFDNLAIAGVEEMRRYLIYPGTPSPQFELLLAGPSGDRAGIRLNVLTGVPETWRP